VLDVRAPEAFDEAHLPGALNLPAGGKSVGTRAGWITSADESTVLIASPREVGEQVSDLLLAAGVWNLAGLAVADQAEWSTGRGAAASFPNGRPMAVACARGPRAAVAASVLRRYGHGDARCDVSRLRWGSLRAYSRQATSRGSPNAPERWHRERR